MVSGAVWGAVWIGGTERRGKLLGAKAEGILRVEVGEKDV